MSKIDLQTALIESDWCPPAAAWCAGTTVQLPQNVLAYLVESGSNASILLDEVGRSVRDLRDRNAYLDAAPAVARSPVSYRAVPGRVRNLLARSYGRLQRARQSSWARFPAFPLDLSADAAADLTGTPTVKFTRTPVLLTHDIDSPEGLENLVSMFLPIEEHLGARSANFVVPCAWPLDHTLLRDVQARGHEIGIHGYDHSNRTAFADPADLAARIAAGRALGIEYSSKGYRAPSLVRSRALLAALDGMYRYDSSIPTSGGLFPVANNGCASARPWQLGTLWELPLSMPRDGSLRFLGYSPDAILELWLQCAKRISASGGIVNLLTHCENGFSGNGAMLRTYREFVTLIAADPGFIFMRPGDLVSRLEAEQRQ